MNKQFILVTGSCGFIGFSVARRLLQQGIPVLGIDNLNDYYDVTLKEARNKLLQEFGDLYVFRKMDVADKEGLEVLFKEFSIQKICHLAAQAGVRYSLLNPFAYQRSNSEGFLNLIEEARHGQVENFVYASSSSVYGGNKDLPFKESARVDHPISFYAATKKANELTAHTYSHLYGIPTTGLRFFTVYGPWGRPDMALFLFTRAILKDEPIDVFNHGKMRRSFTFIEDIVEGVISSLNNPFSYEVFNLGNDKSANLMEYIEVIEECIGKKAKKNFLPLQAGDVPETIADLTHVKEKLGFEPKTDIREGISKFVDWFRDFYQL